MLKKKNRKKVRRLLKESETESASIITEIAAEKQNSQKPSLGDSFGYNFKKGLSEI
jgi:hypothetical protein